MEVLIQDISLVKIKVWFIILAYFMIRTSKKCF